MCAMFASGRAVSGPVPTVHGAGFHRWPHPDSSCQTSAGPWQGPGLSHRMIVADRGVPADWSLSWVSCMTALRLLLSDVSWTMAKPWVSHKMIDQAMCMTGYWAEHHGQQHLQRLTVPSLTQHSLDSIKAIACFMVWLGVPVVLTEAWVLDYRGNLLRVGTCCELPFSPKLNMEGDRTVQLCAGCPPSWMPSPEGSSQLQKEAMLLIDSIIALKW